MSVSKKKIKNIASISGLSLFLLIGFNNCQQQEAEKELEDVASPQAFEARVKDLGVYSDSESYALQCTNGADAFTFDPESDASYVLNNQEARILLVRADRGECNNLGEIDIRDFIADNGDIKKMMVDEDGHLVVMTGSGVAVINALGVVISTDEFSDEAEKVAGNVKSSRIVLLGERGRLKIADMTGKTLLNLLGEEDAEEDAEEGAPTKRILLKGKRISNVFESKLGSGFNIAVGEKRILRLNKNGSKIGEIRVKDASIVADVVVGQNGKAVSITSEGILSRHNSLGEIVSEEDLGMRGEIKSLNISSKGELIASSVDGSLKKIPRLSIKLK